MVKTLIIETLNRQGMSDSQIHDYCHALAVSDTNLTVNLRGQSGGLWAQYFSGGVRWEPIEFDVFQPLPKDWQF